METTRNNTISLSATSRDSHDLTTLCPQTIPAVAEVSPGEGALRFSHRTNNHGNNREEDDCGGNDDISVQKEVDAQDQDAVVYGFGPPPAFPNSRKIQSRNRKRTLMAVSSTVTANVMGNALGDISSDEDDSGSEENGTRQQKNTHSQTIHRIKDKVEGSEKMYSFDDVDCDYNDNDGAKSYIDAMLLASLSDVDSNPRKLVEDFANHNMGESSSDRSKILNEFSVGKDNSIDYGETNVKEDIGSSKATNHNGALSAASTPPRSSGTSVKPYALMPKARSGTVLSSKRGKFASGAGTVSTPPSIHRPDVRDPKADRLQQNEGGAIREETGNIVPHHAPPPMSYPSSTGYPYPHPPHSSAHSTQHPYPHPNVAVGYVAYPPPPSGPTSLPYTHFPHGPHSDSSVTPRARPIYPDGHHIPGSPGRWEQCPQPVPTSSTTTKASSAPNAKKQTLGWTPETIHSSTDYSTKRQQLFTKKNKSHVVPHEDGEQSAGAAAEGVVRRSYHGTVIPPPPPGYPYAIHGPLTRDGYYSGPPPHKYNAVSGDDGSPPRTTMQPVSQHHGGHWASQPGDYYNTRMNTPPRSVLGGDNGQYDYYHDQRSMQGFYHGAYPTAHHHSQTLGDSPMHPHAHPYGNAHPVHPPPYDLYTSPSSMNDGTHPEGSVSLSNKTEAPVHLHPSTAPLQPSPQEKGGVVMTNKHHQFRKGGRSIHSAPVILRKKFSWRNYVELEEYLIANRAEYLRHSALNYTAEQKHFNNQLTEGLLELAAKLNYVFDETCFNFVTVRDRIRCYYKSYVQSSRKRGVVVGSTGNAHHGAGCSE